MKQTTQYEKEGQIEGSIGAIIQLITGVGVAVLVLIFVGSLGGQTYNLVESDIDAIGRTAISSELLPKITTGTPVTLRPEIYTGTFSLTNGTNLKAVGTGNYTLVTSTGTFNLTTATYNQSSVLRATYDYRNDTVSEHIKGGVISGFDALEQTGSYLPIIVLAVVIALVLFLVLGMTGGATGGRNTAL